MIECGVEASERPRGVANGTRTSRQTRREEAV